MPKLEYQPLTQEDLDELLNVPFCRRIGYVLRQQRAWERGVVFLRENGCTVCDNRDVKELADTVLCRNCGKVHGEEQVLRFGQESH